eukprot:m.143751 g.143751  ORF g.143751 m.143751 type:complete len:198 (-) comp14104_c1_seq2:1331-1924(-)
MSMSTTYQDAPFIHADCPTIALPPLPSTNMQPQEAYHSQDWWRQQQSSDEAGSVCTSTCRSSRISSSCSSSGRNSTSTDVSVLDLSLDLSSNYDGGLSAGFDFSPDCLDLDLDLGVGSASCCNSRLSLGVQSTLCSPVFSKNQNSRYSLLRFAVATRNMSIHMLSLRRNAINSGVCVHLHQRMQPEDDVHHIVVPAE